MLDVNLCIVCEDSISDPVCRKCYIKQIEILLNDFDLDEIVNELVLEKVKERFPDETLNNTKCILCREGNIAICRHCFSLSLTNILRELNFPEETVENFGYSIVYEDPSSHKRK